FHCPSSALFLIYSYFVLYFTSSFYSFSFFFFNDTATTEIYTLSLHDALPIYLFEYEQEAPLFGRLSDWFERCILGLTMVRDELADRKSTRLNSSHDQISYAVFCLKKKKKKKIKQQYITRIRTSSITDAEIR